MELSLRRVAGALVLSSAIASVTTLSATQSQGSAADRRTTKSVQKPVSRQVPPRVSPTKRSAVGAAPRTTLPPARLAGTPVKGFASIGAEDWPTPGLARVAHGRNGFVDAYRGHGDGAPALRFRDGKAAFGRVPFLVLAERDGWLKVALPVRPNGTTGWVRTADVVVEPIAYRIVIELSTHTLTVEKDKVPVLRATVAVGTGGTPTPEGLFYVKERVPQPNAAGALGPVALGLSGFSDVLYSFAGGQGSIGVHGTNRPGALGTDASHGCVRVDNATIRRIAELVPLGTPVEIVDRLHDRPASPEPTATTAKATATALPGAAAQTISAPIIETPEATPAEKSAADAVPAEKSPSVGSAALPAPKPLP